MNVAFEARVDAAWLLRGQIPNHALQEAAYTGDDLLHAAREAEVDNPNIVSIYEAYSSSYGNRGSSQVIVLR